jgi:pimeloyl-ACP methyl ester carboxylesterase
MATLAWRTIVVDGRPASYGIAGRGPTVVFLHGWGLSPRTYRQGLERLASRGVRVLAPALPGFGGTVPLPAETLSLAGYGDWLAAFLAEYAVAEPVTLIGHSFGGGVALRAAHDHPTLVEQLVLVDSIGGPVWANRGDLPVLMADRPVWDWGLHLVAHALSVRSFARVAPTIAVDAVPNFLLHPTTLWKVGRLARSADLVHELEALRRHGPPVVLVWGRDDTLLPRACADSLAAALGDPEVVTVPGDHSWLLAEPRRFAEVVADLVGADVAGPAGDETRVS